MKNCCSGNFVCNKCLNTQIILDKIDTIFSEEDNDWYDVYKLTCTNCHNKWMQEVLSGLLEGDRIERPENEKREHKG